MMELTRVRQVRSSSASSVRPVCSCSCLRLRRAAMKFLKKKPIVALS